MRSRWVIAGAGAFVLAVGVGGPVGALSSLSVPPGSEPGLGAVGDAVAIAAGVEWRAGEGGPYAPVVASQPVAVGDGVRTDATGFAEVAYSDGSRPGWTPTPSSKWSPSATMRGIRWTRTALEVGRMWNRVPTVRGGVWGFRGGDIPGNGDSAGHSVVGVVPHRRVV